MTNYPEYRKKVLDEFESTFNPHPDASGYVDAPVEELKSFLTQAMDNLLVEVEGNLLSYDNWTAWEQRTIARLLALFRESK